MVAEGIQVSQTQSAAQQSALAECFKSSRGQSDGPSYQRVLDGLSWYEFRLYFIIYEVRLCSSIYLSMTREC